MIGRESCRFIILVVALFTTVQLWPTPMRTVRYNDHYEHRFLT